MFEWVDVIVCGVVGAAYGFIFGHMVGQRMPTGDRYCVRCANVIERNKR